jgi:excisionase family DNA binding protein
MDITIEQPKPLFSPKTLAEYLAVPEDTINRWRQQGRLPRPDLMVGTRLIRWKYETIISLIQSGQLLD